MKVPDLSIFSFRKKNPLGLRPTYSNVHVNMPSEYKYESDIFMTSIQVRDNNNGRKNVI